MLNFKRFSSGDKMIGSMELKSLSEDIKNLKEMKVIQIRDSKTKKWHTGLLHRVDKKEGFVYLARCCSSDSAIDVVQYRSCSKRVHYEPLVPVPIYGNRYRPMWT